jgi:hypothetical protein
VDAEPCPPRAEVAGDREAVERVVAELRRLGVEIASGDAHDGCATVRAQVGIEDDGAIAVAVRGATRGSEGRVVSDAALAAAWIDSWTRDDVDVALWAAPPHAPETRTVAALDPPGVTPPRDVAPTSPPRVSRWDRVAIAASYEKTWADDDSNWTGASASVCVRVGAFCLGGRARIAFDQERIYKSTGVRRTDASLLATASYPITLGTMSIAPEAGLGAGRMTTHRAEACGAVMPPMNCDPMDPNCPMLPTDPNTCPSTDPGTMTTNVYVGDGFETANITPRFSLAVRLAVPLFQHVWLDGLAAWTFSPFVHSDEYAAVVPDDQIALPGEPNSGYVLGIGLRLGAP